MGKTTRQPLLGLALAAACLAAQASANLALEQGCLNCHGQPPRGKAPTVQQLAERYAPLRSQDEGIRRAAEELRQQPLFGGIAAHEHLSPENAERLLRWLAEGGR